MAGKSGYTAVSNADAPDFGTDITAVYSWFDNLINQAVATSASLPGSGNWLDRRAVASDTGIVYRYNGSAWKAWESEWISYTATLTNFAVGTGGSATSTTRYRYVAGRVEVDFKFQFGTSGQTFPNAPRFSLPVTAATPSHSDALLPGIASSFDDNVGAAFATQVAYNGTATTSVRLWTANYTNITTTTPFGWVAGDVIAGRFTYIPA